MSNRSRGPDPSATDKIADTLADVERPSGRSGYSQQEIDQVLHHVLRQEHDLEDFETGTVVSRPFDPSADMAAALLRIRDGRPKASDLILIEHELAESSYMSSTGARYPEAHAFANERFDWEQSLEAVTDMAGLAYYVKADEDEQHVTYRYGQSPDDLGSELTVDKGTLRPANGVEADTGLTARIALAKIITTFRDRGSWPERGSSFV